MKRTEKLLIIGLGNPGAQYARSLHNAGFMFADYLATTYHLAFSSHKKTNAEIAEGPALTLVKPQTFMNESGTSVAAYLSFFKLPLNMLMVAHDDTDIPLGEFKIQRNRGAAGHNGVQSIIDHVGTNDFWRIRIGVRAETETRPALDFVLASATTNTLATLHNTFKRIHEQLLSHDALPKN